MTTVTRRGFLATSSLAVASVPMAHLTALPLNGRRPVQSYVPDPFSSEEIGNVAKYAVEVLSAPGVVHGDIRVSQQSDIKVGGELHGPTGDVYCRTGYSVRALVGGAWGYSFGTVITREAVSRAARNAIQQAKEASRFAGDNLQMAHVPVLTGSWSTPLEIDPFAVSPDDMAGLGLSITRLGERYPGINVSLSQFYSRVKRVFASTEGSHLTQTLYNTYLHSAVQASDWAGRVRDFVPGIVSGSEGFELALRPSIYDDVYEHIDQARRWLRIPHKDVEVGRYPAVIDGRTLSAVVGKTLGRALDLDRIIGNQANDYGTSFLTADSRTLGVSQFSPHFSLSVDQAPGACHYCRWDDEGVAAQTFEVIRQGAVVDLFGVRENVGVLEPWYQSTSRPFGPRGIARSGWSNREPGALPGALAVPGTQDDSSLDSLIQEIGEGILVKGINSLEVNSDFQLSGGIFSPRDPMIFEIKGGRVAHRIRGAMAQFRTDRFFKSITKTGGHKTLETWVTWVSRGNPLDQGRQAVTAPAALVSELDVTRKPEYKTGADQRFFEKVEL